MSLRQKIIKRLEINGYRLSLKENKLVGLKENERFQNDFKIINIIFKKDYIIIINSKAKRYRYNEINLDFLNWYLFS